MKVDTLSDTETLSNCFFTLRQGMWYHWRKC